MRLLVDTNVLLDFALRREPWFLESRELSLAAATGRIDGLVSSHAVSTFHYFVRKTRGVRDADDAVRALLSIYPLVPLSGDDFRGALALGFGDYEDAVHAVAASKSGADFIATRNGKDFGKSPVPARTPSEVLAML